VSRVQRGVTTPKLHRREFRLRYYEMDSFAQATPTTLLNLIEETAFSHCEESGWDVFRLVSEGFGWVLLKGGLEMSRYPGYRETFTVESWCSSTRSFYGTREYALRDGAGNMIGFARSLWLFYSLERRRPVPVFPEIVAAWEPGGRSAGDMELSDIAGPGIGAIDREREFRVRMADIDTNSHVNNVNYLAWALESIPADLRETSFLHRIRGQFKREVPYGATVLGACACAGAGASVIANAGIDTSACVDKLIHGAYATAPGQSEPYLAATAESTWLPRPQSAIRAA